METGIVLVAMEFPENQNRFNDSIYVKKFNFMVAFSPAPKSFYKTNFAIAKLNVLFFKFILNQLKTHKNT